MIYQITLANDYEQFKFNYELNDNNPTKTWVELAKETKPSDLRSSLDPWRGNSSSYLKMVDTLNSVIDEINVWMPEKINGKWEPDNPVKSLNNLHIHFPEHERYETDPIKRDQLTKFNDLIHGLEAICKSKTINKDLMYLLLCCDNTRMIDLEEYDYQFFQPKLDFGDLTLQYCHVGRHPIELLLSNDSDCPPEQIVPQSQISSYHTMDFYSIPPLDTYFQQFYYNSGLTWPYELTDKRMAIGFINLGKLTTINERRYDNDETLQIVKSCNKILNWQFF